jgi:hypothetical protein
MPNHTEMVLKDGKIEDALSWRGKIGGFLGGVLNPIVTCYLVLTLSSSKTPNGCFEILPVVISLLPLMIMSVRGFYLSGVQDGGNTKKFSNTNIKMIVNKWLWFGTLLGCILAITIFTKIAL